MGGSSFERLSETTIRSLEGVDGRAEEGLRSKCQQRWQEQGAKDRVEARQAPLELVAGAALLLLLIFFFLLHHLVVEDARNEQIDQGANNGREDHPQVRQNVVWLAVREGQQHNDQEETSAPPFADLLVDPGLGRPILGLVHQSRGSAAVICVSNDFDLVAEQVLRALVVLDFNGSISAVAARHRHVLATSAPFVLFLERHAPIFPVERLRELLVDVFLDTDEQVLARQLEKHDCLRHVGHAVEHVNQVEKVELAGHEG